MATSGKISVYRILAVFLVFPAWGMAADLKQSIGDCQLLTEVDRRVACYDAVAESLNADVPEMKGSDDESQKAGDGPDAEHVENSMEAQASKESGALDKRLEFEERVGDNNFIIIPHLPNYLLLYSYNHNPNEVPESPTQEQTDLFEDIMRSEVKFQISFKVQLARNLMPDRTSLWFAYTQKSFFQIYDRANSAPFRESTYEPELFVLYRKPMRGLGFTSEFIGVGINHQSNGRSDPLSRSWNRIMGTFVVNRGNLAFAVKPWWRIPEDEDDDDNPDIEDYLGYAEFGATYKRENKDAVYHLRLFNNLQTDNNRTSVELSYSFPLGGRLKGYIQYYNGYGESMIDYNHRNHRIGIGVLLTDWY